MGKQLVVIGHDAEEGKRDGCKQERVDGEQVSGLMNGRVVGKIYCNILHFDNNHSVYISNLNNIVKYKFINTSQETITIIVYLYGHIMFTALFNQEFNQ